MQPLLLLLLKLSAVKEIFLKKPGCFLVPSLTGMSPTPGPQEIDSTFFMKKGLPSLNIIESESDALLEIPTFSTGFHAIMC